MFAYTAEPGSKSEEALDLLASWAATLDEEERRSPGAKLDPRRHRRRSNPGQSGSS
jgi:hypothetical protein